MYFYIISYKVHHSLLFMFLAVIYQPVNTVNDHSNASQLTCPGSVQLAVVDLRVSRTPLVSTWGIMEVHS